ncbi:MAG TPA: hypothetical protein VNH63_03510 [Gemmatimonadales bacterium]|nr:hypothetical protein [Gemmatimonadales bacterium]
MQTRSSFLRLAAFVASALMVAGCSRDAVSPTGPARTIPRLSAATLAPVAPGTGITLDAQVGTLNEHDTTVLAKGFNGAPPHLGDAMVATIFWSGTNTLTSVSDFMTDVPRTPVGNTFRLVEFVSSGGISMATYVATNIQGFPDPNPDPAVVYAVQARFTQPVVDGGMLLTAYKGVDAVSTQPVEASRSGFGTAATNVFVGPGAVAVGTGALAYGVTMSNGLVGRDPPAGYIRTPDGVMGDNVMIAEGDYMVSGALGTTNPQWMWAFSAPSTWLASVVSLNPAPHLVFTAQPKTTLPLTTMPAVQVTVTDALGNAVPSFTGTVTIAIGHNGGTVAPGTLSGTKTVTVVNGVATFADLSIDQLGNGYTLTVTAGGVVGAESAAFNIGVM